MWKIMARAYPQHFRQLSSLYCLEVERPKEPLKVYIDLMICGPCNWRAVLGLSSSYATITDLVAIGNMKNLVALEIYTSPSRDMKPQDYDEGRGLGLDDRIVRSWVEVAESSGSLQQLRVLRLCKQANLTTHALWMLEKLPHLQLLVAYHCGSLNEGLKESIKGKKDGVRFGGWIACRLDSILGDQEAETMGFRHLCPLLDVYKDILSTASDGHGHVAPDRGPKSCAGLGSEQEPSNMGSDVPIMEFQLSRGFIISGSDPEMVLNRAKYEAAQFVFLTRVPSREKKRAPSQSIPRSKGKRVMKDRVGRDMADVLGDFL